MAATVEGLEGSGHQKSSGEAGASWGEEQRRPGEKHRVQMPPAQGGARRGRRVAAPEKWVNCFVRVVALMERTGNALGTLAFTWATVVLLGGYLTMLRSYDDFYYATVIVFIEATRYAPIHTLSSWSIDNPHGGRASRRATNCKKSR
uniref:Uncharacterized protein n=1 Tax=Oryza punctata TaxID=4537 RepID=A0A0E0LP66_ORYPU